MGRLLEDEVSLTGVLVNEVATLAGTTVAGVTLKLLPDVDAELVDGTAACVALEPVLELSQRPWHRSVVVVFVLLQRRFIEGMTAGAVKS